MDDYYVNDNRQESKDGVHNEVHKEGCYWLKQVRDKTYLGYFTNCKDAMVQANKRYPYSADGCKICCNDCHKG